MPDPSSPRYLAAGDTALVVEFGARIDPALNDRVMALAAAIDGVVAGVVETVPTYRSLCVHYDPNETGFERLVAEIRAIVGGLDAAHSRAAGRHWRVPVVYGGAFGVDLDWVAAEHGLTPAELIARHAAPVYRVYMIGFLPGFAYLGGLDPSIATPRRTDPRAKTPAGTISIGGIQAAVAAIEGPSGWHLLGRTPMRNFMKSRDPAFILAPGDRVSFAPMPAEAWDELDRAAADGALVAELLP